MQSQCSCPKWYDVLNLEAVFALIDKYEAHPVYGKGFNIYQPCFVCQNDDRIPENRYAVDEFNAKELFGDVPQPSTLNLYFVGNYDDNYQRSVRTNQASE